MKSPLKWLGGKHQIIDHISKALPLDIRGHYYEPFVGGGTVLLHVLERVANGTLCVGGRVIASDANPYLIRLYVEIQCNVDSLIRELCTLQTFSESYYYERRDEFNRVRDDPACATRAAALFLYLNRTCFRGVYREGPRGFNVPYGHYAAPVVFEDSHLRRVASLIRDVDFRCCSFEVALANVLPDDFVYLDPPYAPEKATSFVKYTRDGFSMDQHVALFARCQSLHRFVMSNSDVELVRAHFSAPVFAIESLVCRRAIHCKSPNARASEVLVRRSVAPTN